jgi:hypothetical protein
LTEYASKEYGQGIRCLLHLPTGDPRGRGESGKESIGVVARREVKRPAGKTGGEPPRPDQIPLHLRIGSASQGESVTERHRPPLREYPPVALVQIVPHGDTSFLPPGNSARTMLYSTGHHHPQPALSKNEHYGPGWAPAPAHPV